jgi:L-2,4-diaminobutyrate transaminase
MARALDFGMVAVNRVKITGAPIPFGGWKQSGLGREGSRHGSRPSASLNISASTPGSDRASPAFSGKGLTMLNQSNDLVTWDRDTLLPSLDPYGRARPRRDAHAHHRRRRGRLHHRPRRRSSLDAFAGLYCVNVGYGRRRSLRRSPPRRANLAYYHAYVGHGTEASITLAKMIIERAPAGMSRVYFGLSGSDANETNLKLIWYYNNVLGRPQKKKIISRWRGYHGSGVMTGSLTGP